MLSLPSRNASLPTVWDYVLPALEGTQPSRRGFPPVPTLGVAYRMNVHTAVYNYLNSDNGGSKGAAQLYRLLDEYFAGQARKVLHTLPAGATTLVAQLVKEFTRYNAHAHAIARLIPHINRSYVDKEIDEGHGWCHRQDMQLRHWAAVAQNELHLWGCDCNRTIAYFVAKTCAEAGSPHGCIIPLYSLALRRFRTECVEPLVAAPQNRLTHAMHALPEASSDTSASDGTATEVQRQRSEGNVLVILKMVGVRLGHN